MNFSAWDTVFGLLLCGLTLIVLSEDVSKPKPIRYEDKPFPKHNLIYGRNVTCGDVPKHKKNKFVAHTWTCHDLRVNNMRIAYGYYSGMGVDTRCNSTGGTHEFAQLCRELLSKVVVNKELYALYVPEAYPCHYLNESRVLLNRTDESVFEWADIKTPGNGWLVTLQCMIKM